LMKPIVPPKYDVQFRIFNANELILSMLEPWCDNIYVDIVQINLLKIHITSYNSYLPYLSLMKLRLERSN